MADENSLLKLKFKLKGIYNNAIQKPIKDMCLFEMDEELTYKLKDVNRTGIWDTRTDEIIEELLSRRYYEKYFGAEFFLNIIEQLKSDNLRKEFVHRYAGIINEQSIDGIKELCGMVGGGFKREFYPFVQQLQAETFEKYGDFDKIPRDKESKSIVGKQLKQNQIAEMLLQHMYDYLDMNMDTENLPKSERLNILATMKAIDISSLPASTFSDLTIDDIKSYCRKTGNYAVFDKSIPALNEYYEHVTFNDIQDFLDSTKDKQLQNRYLARAIPIFYDRGNISKDEYIKLANDERIENKTDIYGHIFTKQNFDEVLQTIKSLPEDKQQYAVKAVERAFMDEMQNEAFVRSIYGVIKSSDVKKDFLIDIVNESKDDRFAIFKKDDVINAMKENSNRFYSYEIYGQLTQEELLNLYMETEDKNVRTYILSSSFDAIRNKKNPRDEEENIWGESRKIEIPSIITEENMYDIFEKIDMSNEFQVSEFMELDGFDFNQERVLKKIYADKKRSTYIKWIEGIRTPIDAKMAINIFKESNTKNRNDAWDLCRINLDWNVQEENSLYNNLMAISGINDIYCENIILEDGLLQKNYGIYSEGMLFDIPEINDAIQNKTIPMQTRINLFSLAMSSYYRQLDACSEEAWLQKFKDGFYDISQIFENGEEKKKTEEELLSDANIMINRLMEDIPKDFLNQYNDVFSRAKSSKSLEEKARLCGELSEKFVEGVYNMLMKKLEDFSQMTGIDHYTLFKRIEENQKADSSSVRNVLFKYIKLIPYLNNREMFNKFTELYANNENVINSITVEMLQPEVFANLDNNLIEYLSAYEGAGNRIRDVIDNEKLLQAFTKCHSYLQQINEFSEEKIANVLTILLHFRSLQIMIKSACFQRMLVFLIIVIFKKISLMKGLKVHYLQGLQLLILSAKGSFQWAMTS